MASIERRTSRRAASRGMVLSLAATLLLVLSATAPAQQQKPAAQAKPPVPGKSVEAPAGAAVSKPVEPPRQAEQPKVNEVVVPNPMPSSGQGKGYFLGTGDVVRITVFQQPDMATETRVSELGTVTFPLLGPVEVAGLSPKQVETTIGNLLKARGFVRDPQVNVTILQFKSRQFSVLGHVNRPGRYALEEGVYYVTDAIALAGGTSTDASDTVTLVRQRDGKIVTLEIDIPALFRSNGTLANPEVIGGDTIFVDRFSYFYIYGEVQRPGVYRLEKGMTLMQALSVGGGMTLRASKKDIQVNRRDKTGKVQSFPAQLNDLLLADDVIYVKESLF